MLRRTLETVGVAEQKERTRQDEPHGKFKFQAFLVFYLFPFRSLHI